MLLSVWYQRFYPLIPIYGENGAGRKNMALLQVEAVSVVKIAKMQDTKFDLNFGAGCITPELEHRKSGYVERKRRPYQGNVVRIA